MEHVSKLLSAFMDGKLAQAEREMVESHLERCEACSAELKDLKSLSRLLAATPAEPLPTGFLQRLENRRKAEAEADKAERAYFIPPRWKLAAAGMSAAVVFIFAYDVLRGPGRVEERVRDLAPLSRLTELGPNRLEGRAGAAGSPAPTDKIFGMAAAPAAAPAQAPALSRNELHAAGAPLTGADTLTGAGSAFSNEQLRAHLDQERKKLGITEIVPRGMSISEPNDIEVARRGAVSREQARAYMRQMADSLQRERMQMENYHEPVALGASSKPRLLKKQSARAAAGAPVAPEPAPSEQGEGSIAMVDGKSARTLDSGSAADAEARPAAKAVRGAAFGAAPATIGNGLAAAGGGAMLFSNPSAAPATASGAAQAAAPEAKAEAAASPAARAARSAGELAALWKELGKSSELPAVDFSSEMIVALQASSGVEIVNVKTTRSRVIIEYRDAPDGAKTAFRVVPKSDLPVAAKRVQ